MKSADFLDALKRKFGIRTDRRLGQILNISHPRVSLYRNGEREFDDDTCKLVASKLDEPVEFVLTEIRAIRDRRSQNEAAWRRLARLARKGKAEALNWKTD